MDGKRHRNYDKQACNEPYNNVPLCLERYKLVNDDRDGG
jgi:hypothetical protein